MSNERVYDVIVAGSGMGGMTAAALLANDGFRVLVLEAAHALGGCSSSFYRQGYWFESGATTLIGFDEYQPLRFLEQQTGISIPRLELQPSMQVHQDGEVITRYKNIEEWIAEASQKFKNSNGQRKFWELAKDVSEIVWKVSLKNNFFPPTSIKDFWSLITQNNPKDVWILPYLFQSVDDVMSKYGVDTPKFRQFIDEQLMITAQSTAEDTPFLFGATAITYTNYSNYYVPGGLIKMVHEIRDFILCKRGTVKTKSRVKNIVQQKDCYKVQTASSTFTATSVISNIPVWNMGDITTHKISDYFSEQAKNYEQAWGAFTMGIATKDSFPSDLPLHHQFHIENPSGWEFSSSQSIFVSLSHPDDNQRAKEGTRILNVSMHTIPDQWYVDEKGEYERRQKKLSEAIVKVLHQKLPGFSKEDILKQFSATPLTWENWVYRKKGRVGGIPQSMSRSLFDWIPAETPFEGLFLCGDTVFPGQGIPGVTLSGINAYHRVKRYWL